MPKKYIKIVERPSCAIKGYFPPATGRKFGEMCGKVSVGGRSCHYEGPCEHQRTQEAKQGDAA